MFKISLYFFLLISQTFSEPKNSGDPKLERIDTGDSVREKALQQYLKNEENLINSKISELEKAQPKVVQFNKKLEKVITILNENTLTTLEERQNYSITRYIEYEFEGGSKIKEIRFIYKKKSLKDNVIYLFKTMYMTPGNFDSIRIITEKVENKALGVTSTESYKEFSPDVKLKTLKIIDSNLQGSIYQLDAYLQNSKRDKDKKSENELVGF
jgi:hypothetical protein